MIGLPAPGLAKTWLLSFFAFTGADTVGIKLVAVVAPPELALSFGKARSIGAGRKQRGSPLFHKLCRDPNTL